MREGKRGEKKRRERKRGTREKGTRENNGQGLEDEKKGLSSILVNHSQIKKSRLC
jgi:hypothetical protein